MGEHEREGGEGTREGVGGGEVGEHEGEWERERKRG